MPCLVQGKAIWGHALLCCKSRHIFARLSCFHVLELLNILLVEILQADLIGMMADGNGRKHLAEMVIPIPVGAINLHHPQCLLGPPLMLDLFLHGWVARHLTWLVCLISPTILNHMLAKLKLSIIASYITLGQITLTQTGITTGSAASPWDTISPSPIPIRASGASVRSSSSRHSGRSHQLNFSMENLQSSEVLGVSVYLKLDFFCMLFVKEVMDLFGCNCLKHKE